MGYSGCMACKRWPPFFRSGVRYRGDGWPMIAHKWRGLRDGGMGIRTEMRRLGGSKHREATYRQLCCRAQVRECHFAGVSLHLTCPQAALWYAQAVRKRSSCTMCCRAVGALGVPGYCQGLCGVWGSAGAAGVVGAARGAGEATANPDIRPMHGCLQIQDGGYGTALSLPRPPFRFILWSECRPHTPR